jgi:4-hydroxy-2-oxovalerate aldolase
MNTVSILDCTLRDGSYAIDYQFTAEDTAIIAVGLEKVGFRLIEIGHGLGLGASSQKYGNAAATDEEYLIAAQKYLKKAKFGMFCIPGIAQVKDLKKATRYNIGFIRIGTNVTQLEQAEEFIKRAKDLGIIVFSNLMKSYAVDSLEFAKKVKQVYVYGADAICVVDSAGGMLPVDVREYIKIVKNETGAKIGFHGHDNLRLAIANSLEAVRSGATIIDATLKGIGRSAGNAQTEIIAILLDKMGYKTGVNLYKTLDFGEKIIKPIAWEGKGVDAISVLLGATQFHSSFVKIIEKFAQKYGVYEKRLITEVSKINRVNVTDELVENVAKNLKPGKKNFMPVHFDFNVSSLIKKYNPNDIKEISLSIINEMVNISKKTGKKIVFTLASTLNKERRYTAFPFVRHNEIYIIGNAEVISKKDALAIIKTIDGFADFILIDHSLYNDLSGNLIGLKSLVLAYSDSDAQVVSVNKMINFLSSTKLSSVFISGSNYLAKSLIMRLLFEGYRVINDNFFNKKELYAGFKGNLIANDVKNVRRADFIVGFTPYEISITQDMLYKLKKGVVLIDAGPGSIATDAIDCSLRRGIHVYRIDMRAGLFGEVESVLKNYYLKRNIIGERKIKAIQVVSGGVIGKKGDIVLDSVNNPSRVIGVADGKGGLILGDNRNTYSSRIIKARNYVTKTRFM